jgi:hypothetical protein
VALPVIDRGIVPHGEFTGSGNGFQAEPNAAPDGGGVSGFCELLGSSAPAAGELGRSAAEAE